MKTQTAVAAPRIGLLTRRRMFRLAWLLLVASLLIPVTFSFSGPQSLGLAVAYVYGKAVAWGAAPPEAAGALGFGQAALLALALLSQILFLYTLYLRDDRAVSIGWKGLALAALAVAAGIAPVVPELARLSAYWVWLAAMATLAVGFVAFGGAEGAPATRPSKRDSVIDRGEVPPFVWMLLGFTVFWIAVGAADRALAPPDSATAAIREPLTGYVNDRAQLLTADEARRLASALQAFEAATPNQVAVAIYPHAPAGAIEDFTIGAAERLPLGRAGLDSGAILFVFVSERAARLEVGYGLEGTLTDAASHRILESMLAPAFARGAYFDGLDATLKAIFSNVQDGQKREGRAGIATVWARKLESERPKRIERFVRSAGGIGLGARIGISLLCAIVGLILWSVVPGWVPLGRDLRRGLSNLRARRPFAAGMEKFDGEEVWDTLRLVVWTIGVIVPAVGVIIVAGGGAFGGAGALIHW